MRRSRVIKEIEELEDAIYESLSDIEKEEEIKLDDKAFVSDFLSEKLYAMGYRKVKEVE